MARRRIEKNASSNTPPKMRVAQNMQADAPDPAIPTSPDYRVAIDFGTTFTTIAFARCHGLGSTINVFTIEEFPGDRWHGRNGTQVPTEIWYLSDIEDATTSETQIKGDLNVLYGYQIARRLELPESDELRTAFKDSGIVSRPKLLLDDSPHLGDLRKDLTDTLKQLREDGFIKRPEEVIEHLLTRFFKHTKSVLERDHGLSKSSTIEVTLAVPVCWSAKSNTAMSTCLQKALKTVQFGTDGTTAPHLFMVNEAEAAATYALSSETSLLHRDECFILLDCGGGTTDIGTYRVARDQPLRLGEEVTHPQGAICGSSDLNVRMRRFAAVNLRDELYLEDEEGMTINNIITSEIMPHFESDMKRFFDITKDENFTFRIRGLRKSSTNSRLRKDCLVLTSKDMRSLFDESFKTIESLLLGQIDHARRNKTLIDKVVLAGGFCDSPALREYLKATLERVNA